MTTPETDPRVEILAEALYNERNTTTTYREAVRIADEWRDEKQQYYFRLYIQEVDNTRKKAAKLLRRLDEV